MTKCGSPILQRRCNFIGTHTYWRITGSYNRFDRLTGNLVLASRASVCDVEGTPPVFKLCLFGFKNDIRGYPVGQFQDKAMFALQSELRWHAFWRIGFVAFGGIGSIGRNFGAFDNILIAGGGGLRFLVSRDYGVNFGIDGAINKDGDTSLYFRAADAF